MSSNWQGRAAGNCNIKGNRSRKGRRIYRPPGMPSYDAARAGGLLDRGGGPGGGLPAGDRQLRISVPEQDR